MEVNEENSPVRTCTIKLENKNNFILTFQRVWKTVKCQGKIREKSGNFEVTVKWQPCYSGLVLGGKQQFSAPMQFCVPVNSTKLLAMVLGQFELSF